MLVYDHDRTEQIVDRLRKAERFARIVAYVTAVVAFACATVLLTGLKTAGILGALLGFVVGRYLVALFSVVIEWMCQMLIAQGSIVNDLEKQRAS